MANLRSIQNALSGRMNLSKDTVKFIGLELLKEKDPELAQEIENLMNKKHSDKSNK